MQTTALPETIRSESQLESLLSEPSEAAVEAMSRVPGDVLLLGAGGKMGPSLARMIRQASQQAGISRKIVAVSRFSNKDLQRSLQEDGIETIRGDLLEEPFVDALPEAPNVIFMAGMKFGTRDNAAATWAMNVYLPSLVCRRFPNSKILAFSTGNVYPFVPIESGGSLESDLLNPVGEYGMSALGRERMFEYFCCRENIPTTIIRLNYAMELRYGILLDLAQRVYEEQPIDLTVGYMNVIWQADANAMVLSAMADAQVPAHVVNVAGDEIVSVKDTCEKFAQAFGKRAHFINKPAPTALLNNAQRTHQRYGSPRVGLDRMIAWTAAWVNAGGVVWNKPTHFEVSNGQF